jgi:hypothetical protein
MTISAGCVRPCGDYRVAEADSGIPGRLPGIDARPETSGVPMSVATSGGRVQPVLREADGVAVEPRCCFRTAAPVYPAIL